MSAPILRRTICPHCWTPFAPEDALWIATHDDLRGDTRLGPDEMQRFLPSRFSVDGQAIDPRGMLSKNLACPNCHLAVPRAVIEAEPLFISILGTPASGKSFYLGAMTWQLRQHLPDLFAVSFADADPAANRRVIDYEEALFLHPEPDKLQLLGNLIMRTPLVGDLYNTVSFGNQTIRYAKPFLFVMWPTEHHPFRSDELGRVLCLYDNSGESFLPGKDSDAEPVTQHLAHSRAMLFLFDPVQDPRFRKLIKNQGGPVLASDYTMRQELVLREAATRVRKLTGLPTTAKHDRPLIVVLTKADLWGHLLSDSPADQPWKQVGTVQALDKERIEALSNTARSLLLSTCREVVYAAEEFARQVLYVPVSSLGPGPIEMVKHQGQLAPAIRPSAIRPQGVMVPILYGLNSALPRLIPALKRKSADAVIAGKSQVLRRPATPAANRSLSPPPPTSAAKRPVKHAVEPVFDAPTVVPAHEAETDRPQPAAPAEDIPWWQLPASLDTSAKKKPQ